MVFKGWSRKGGRDKREEMSTAVLCREKKFTFVSEETYGYLEEMAVKNISSKKNKKRWAASTPIPPPFLYDPNNRRQEV